LKRDAAALKRQGAALKAEEASLKSRAASLQTQKAALERQGAALQAEMSRLEAEGARLTAEKTRLMTKLQALAAEGQALAAQIAAVQQQLAVATDPVEIAALQAQLATLGAQAQAVQAEAAGVQADLEALAKPAARLSAQGKSLERRAASLTAQGSQLQAQATQLSAAGAALARQGAQLERRADKLARRERALKRDAKTAEQLKDELTEILTKAGGEERATDPRLTRLQDALEAAAGVESVSPPRVSDDGSAVLISVVPTTRPADPATSDLVADLRGNVLPEALEGAAATAYIGGVTAAFYDLSLLISRRLPLVIGVVLALSFLILLVAFRSLLVPIKAILCNLLAVGASFGVITAVFQWGWGIEAVGISSPYGTVPVASYVPLLMFAVLFGMSTDYEVFLISQIFGYHEAGEDSYQAVRSGVGASARVITAAALIMVTVFASFTLHPDPVIKQFGVGLSIAILLDATIVRLVIVPATMVLLGEWNWYLPRWMQWLNRLDVAHHGGAAAER
jgi:predicted  nucleic acid-binding Zn-ribbon protein